MAYMQFGPLRAHDFPVANAVATVIMAHGIGLGPWMFEPWAETFGAWKLRLVAVELPGHGPDGGDAGLDTVIEALAGAVKSVVGPVVVLGHSMAALAAQKLAERSDMQHLHGLVLLCPMPPGQVRVMPEREQLGHVLSALPVLLGRPHAPTAQSYRALGFNRLPDGEIEAALAKVVPWPPTLAKACVRRPHVEPTALTMPVLVAIGFHDKVIRWQKARLLGDLYESVVWRYDDLGHMPPLEPGGLRMARDIAKWCVEPTRPQVIESEGFGPTEGVGHLIRRARRGELMKKRSAYGQKKAAR